MRFHDQHVHTYYSSDCKQVLEPYFKEAIKYNQDTICFTDHLDFNCSFYGGKDVLFDYEKLVEEAKELGEKYNIEVLIGCEMGYRKDLESKIKDYLASKYFDVILLSVHEDDLNDFYSITTDPNITVEDAIQSYFKAINNLLDSDIDFDVLTHTDYLFRYFEEKILFKNYQDEYIKILSKLIKRDKSLEINTGSIKYFKNYDFIEFIIKLYSSLGGKLISLGSDSHMSEHYKIHFEDIIEILKENNINHITLYKGRKRELIEI